MWSYLGSWRKNDRNAFADPVNFILGVDKYTQKGIY